MTDTQAEIIRRLEQRVRELERERQAIQQTAMDWGNDGDAPVAEFINLLAVNLRLAEARVRELERGKTP